MRRALGLVVVALVAVTACEAADSTSADDSPSVTQPETDDPDPTTEDLPSQKPERDKPKATEETPPPKPPKRTPQGVPRGAQLAIVDRIVDGDTLELHARRPGPVLRSTAITDVRLLEIDTPETVHPSEPVQCYGPAASQALARLAPVGSTVWVLPDLELTDPYDRTLLYLWSTQSAGRALFVNRALVTRGFAKASLYEPNDLYIDTMYAAEQFAQIRENGLWGHCPRFGAPLNTPEPPAPDPPSGGGGNCDPNYSGACIPPYPPDLDCTEIDAQGFQSTGNDPHSFDADGDGIACDV